MVIAASLSQVQNLLQHDALLSKPQLLETFDRALTGCRVVYGCLEEEVRDLVTKTENDDLGFKDRARFLWREDTFKELLTQIRGQQSALSLLIQGLQMESIADIRKLVTDNSATLDQVVKRSRTLRQQHPRLNVPESIFNHESEVDDVVDADSIIKSTEFAFDDEVINSKSYRRAMALYTSQNKADMLNHLERQCLEDDTTALGPSHYVPGASKESTLLGELPITPKSVIPPLEPVSTFESEIVHDQRSDLPADLRAQASHEDLFDALEQDILAFMPHTSIAPVPTEFKPQIANATTVQSNGILTPAPLRKFSGAKTAASIEEAPALPPRRPSAQSSSGPIHGESKVRSTSSDDSICTSDSPSVLSKVSTASSYTIYENSQFSSVISRKPVRKPVALSRSASSDVFQSTLSDSVECESPVSYSPFENAEMYSIWLSMVEAEQNFVDRLTKLRKMFYDNLIRQWPILEKHIGAILVSEQIANLNQEYLLHIMKKQTSFGESTVCDPIIFETWTNKVHRLYREFCQRMPHAISSIRTTETMDSKFTPFVNTLGLSIAYFGMGWEDYLKLPNIQLQTYIDNIQSLIDVTKKLDPVTVGHEAARLERALEAVKWLKTLTSTLVEEAQNREDIQNIEKRIHTLDASFLSRLHLLHPSRRVRHQGGMAMKLKSQGPWHALHVMLLDNFLVWGKVKPQKKNRADKVLVLDAVSPPSSVHNRYAKVYSPLL